MGIFLPGSANRRTIRFTTVVAVGLVAIGALIALPASGAPPSIGQKQREAETILAQISALDSDLNRAVEAYNGARLHLAKTQKAIASNTHVLRVARHNLKRSQQTIADRLRALYMSADSQATIEIVLGARSLDEVISGLDAAERVTEQDTEIAREAGSFRVQVERRQQTLIVDRKKASALVAESESRRSTIESSLAQRKQLLASVKDEIDHMQAAERQRQLQIAAQVRIKLAEQRRAREAIQTQAPEQKAPSSTNGQTTPATPSTVSSSAAPSSAPPARYAGVVGIAMRYLGVPYQWGGASPSTGFDCSGFTMYVYAQIGVSLPHYTGDQWRMGTAVSREDLQPGDLVFFDGLGHEGMYIGGNQFIHAPHTGDVVKISSISGWYADTYMGARRL